MVNRLQHILFMLASNEGALTSEAIAKDMGLSVRTIKTALGELRNEIEEVGATLIAERNKGYSVKVNEPEKFNLFMKEIKTKLSLVRSLASEEEQEFLHLARKIVSSIDYVKIEDIAEEMYISRSTIRSTMRKVVNFLENFDIVIDSKAGLGIKAIGKEYELRMAMTELYIFHYHKLALKNVAPEYAKWIQCSLEERQVIRQNLLKTLFKNKVSVLDTNTQRAAIYLFIAKNRYGEGYQIKLSSDQINEIKQYKEYEVAKKVFSDSAKCYEGYDVKEDEIAFLAMWILNNRDMNHEIADRKSFPTFYDKAEEHTNELIQSIKKEFNIDINCYDWVYDELKSMLIPIIAGKHFKLKRDRNPLRLRKRKSLLCLEIAKTMVKELTDEDDENFWTTSIIYMFAGFIYKILFFTSYDIKKLKLLIVETDGISYGEIIERQLFQHFSLLIDSCTNVELYEIRNMNQEEYDAVVIDNIDFLYNYDLPHCTINTLLKKYELKKVHNSVLIKAYQVEKYLPNPDIINIYKPFEFKSIKEFFNLISYKHSNSGENQKRLYDMFISKELMYSYNDLSDAVVVFGNIEYTNREAFEVYFLDKCSYWVNKEIKYLVYVCINWNNDITKVKFYDNIIDYLSTNTKLYQLFAENKETALEEIIYQSLKM